MDGSNILMLLAISIYKFLYNMINDKLAFLPLQEV